MIASTHRVAQPTPDQLQAQFLVLMPKLLLHARIYFRNIKCRDKKADKIQECLALGWKSFLQLHENGKDINEFVMVFVYMIARAVKCGRRACGQEKAKDVMNEWEQHRQGFKVESLPTSTSTSYENLSRPQGQRTMDAIEERLQDNTITPVPDQVQFRMDFPAFLNSITPRDRKLAEYLGLGHKANHAAEMFNLTPGRVTQLRQQWQREWRVFQGEPA